MKATAWKGKWKFTADCCGREFCDWQRALAHENDGEGMDNPDHAIVNCLEEEEV